MLPCQGPALISTGIPPYYNQPIKNPRDYLVIYNKSVKKEKNLVDVIGLEPTTSSM